MFRKPSRTVELGAADVLSLGVTYLSDLAAGLGSRQSLGVVLLTSRYDVDADLLQVHLNAEGYDALRLNCEDFPTELVSFLCDNEGSVLTKLRYEASGSIPIEPKVIVYRHFDYLPPACRGVDGEIVFEANQRRQMAICLEEHFNQARWINHPHAVARCRNRILQLQLASKAGLATPNTLITNDRIEAESFVRINGSVIAKAIGHHGVRSETRLYEFFGRLLTEPAEVRFIDRQNPVLLQEYIPKIAEIRVYVIEDTVIAVRIEAKASYSIPVDMHTMPLDSYVYSQWEASPATLHACRALTSALGLTYGAFDFVQTDGNRLVFLEVNPGGDWAWIDSQVGLGLTTTFAKAIASYLTPA